MLEHVRENERHNRISSPDGMITAMKIAGGVPVAQKVYDIVLVELQHALKAAAAVVVQSRSLWRMRQLCANGRSTLMKLA